MNVIGAKISWAICLLLRISSRLNLKTILDFFGSLSCVTLFVIEQGARYLIPEFPIPFMWKLIPFIRFT